MLTREEKTKIINEYKAHPNDSGSPELQIALITNRINSLMQHFSTHKQDFHSRTGLMKLVGQRKRLLEYVKKSDPARYEKIIQKLNLRK